ncbi:hypothetical protein [Lacticaseibacillus sharpeae]|uniref:hypothetical protein n=1 Tax=Lacticaseibacillus sharpeae TaxID=1626 RepID=UPI0006D18733|nr:hypothetical protein [Lacticaseibacillus sharpeae]
MKIITALSMLVTGCLLMVGVVFAPRFTGMILLSIITFLGVKGTYQLWFECHPSGHVARKH